MVKKIKSIKSLSMLLVFILTFGLITPPSVVNAADSAVQVTKTIDKTTIKTNDEAQVNLAIKGTPPVDVVMPNDVILIIDRSGSMRNGGKMAAAKDAAKGFVDLMDLTKHRVGIVDFSSNVHSYPLSQDKDKVKAYIDTINYDATTGTGAAIRQAINMLSNHRPEAQPVIVILTDGDADNYSDAKAAAQQAKDAGIVFYTIALLMQGENPDISAPNSLLKEMATTEKHHHWVLGSTGLAEIYANIVKQIGISSAYDVVVKDVVSPEFEIVPGSYDNNIPKPEVVGNQLTWRFKELKEDTLNFTYKITPKDKNKAGTFPVSKESTIEYRNYTNTIEKYTIEAPSLKVECLKPEITSVTPDKGVIGGGNEITIKGNNFRPNATVTIGSANATNVQVVSANEIKATVPAGVPGSAVLTVKNDDGQTDQSNYNYYANPEITSITPDKGYMEGGTSVTIAGNYYLPGVKVFINNVEATVTNSTTTSITCTTPKSSVDGDVDVKVVNPDSREVTKPNGFKYVGKLEITSVTPDKGLISGGNEISIKGNYFKPNATVTIGSANATNVQVISANEIKATVPAGVPGSAVLTVKNDDGQTVQSNYNYYANPEITSITPDKGPSSGGTKVSITGNYYLPGVKVFINNVEAKVTDSTTTSITCITPKSSVDGDVDVKVVNPDSTEVTKKNGFKYAREPEITSVTPNKGLISGGNEISIKGNYFKPNATVTIGSADATNVQVISANEIKATVPAGVQGTAELTVKNDDGQTAQSNYTYYANPEITSITPDNGPSLGGTKVSITGKYFLPGVKVYFNGIEATVTISTATSISVNSPKSRIGGGVDVKVVNPDSTEISRPNGFNYVMLPAPEITSVIPKEGSLAGGETIYINGKNFRPGATVKMGGKDVSPLFVTEQQIGIKALPATQPGDVDITVTNLDDQIHNLSNAYTYLAPPKEPAPIITSVDPKEGSLAGGETIYINGKNFKPGAIVKMGGKDVLPLFVSEQQIGIKALPATEPGTVDITVTNPDEQIAPFSNAYKYLAPPVLPQSPAPIITSVDPKEGSLAGGETIYINGKNFNARATVKMGGKDVSPLFVSEQQIGIKALPATEPGSVDITVTNPDGQTAPFSNAYKYLAPPAPPAPIISSLSKTSGIITGGDSVYVYGINFQSEIKAKLGGKDATVNFYNSGCLMITIPPTTVEGFAALELTNPDNQSVKKENVYEYLPIPVIPAPKVTSLSKTSGIITGGDSVYVYGTGFQSNVKVKLGGQDAKTTFYNSGSLMITIPPTTVEGSATLEVINPDGQSVKKENIYQYLPIPKAPAPTITSISKNTGVNTGGEYIYVYGTGFQSGIKAKFGDVETKDIYFYSSTQIRITTPKTSVEGAVDLELINPDNQNVVSSSKYTYTLPLVTITSLSATQGEYTGGYSIYVYGTNIDKDAKVTVNGKEVKIVYYNATSINILSMPSSEEIGLGSAGGAATITITNPSGKAGSATFTYNAKPATPIPNISSLSATSGPVAGNNDIYVYGTGFTNTMKVRIYDSSNNIVNESSIYRCYGSSSALHYMPAVSTPGTYTIKLVNSDGIEGKGIQYSYK